MPTHRRTLTRTRVAALVFAAGLPLAACSQDNPVSDEGTEVVGGDPAPDEAVTEDLTVTGVLLAFPADGVWAEGEDVPLYAAVANTGKTGDVLVDVRSEGFADAVLTGRDGEEGAIEVKEDDNLYLEPDGMPSVLLLDAQESLRSSQSVPVTFVFEEAGEVTLPATVAPESPAEGSFTTPQDPTND